MIQKTGKIYEFVVVSSLRTFYPVSASFQFSRFPRKFLSFQKFLLEFSYQKRSRSRREDVKALSQVNFLMASIELFLY